MLLTRESVVMNTSSGLLHMGHLIRVLSLKCLNLKSKIKMLPFARVEYCFRDAFRQIDKTSVKCLVNG